MVTYDQMKSKVEEMRLEKRSLQRRLQDEKERHGNLATKLSNLEKAHSIIQIVAQSTQQNLQYHFSKLVTSALKGISSEWPDFEVEFVPRRNRTECDLLFSQNGVRQHPLESSGGGPKDVASFALRCAYWAIRKNRRVLILDEPFKYVSPDLQGETSEMVKSLSSSLKLQILMVSHQTDINIAADRTFFVERKGDRSRVEEV